MLKVILNLWWKIYFYFKFNNISCSVEADIDYTDYDFNDDFFAVLQKLQLALFTLKIDSGQFEDVAYRDNLALWLGKYLAKFNGNSKNNAIYQDIQRCCAATKQSLEGLIQDKSQYIGWFGWCVRLIRFAQQIKCQFWQSFYAAQCVQLVNHLSFGSEDWLKEHQKYLQAIKTHIIATCNTTINRFNGITGKFAVLSQLIMPAETAPDIAIAVMTTLQQQLIEAADNSSELIKQFDELYQIISPDTAPKPDTSSDDHQLISLDISREVMWKNFRGLLVKNFATSENISKILDKLAAISHLISPSAELELDIARELEVLKLLWLNIHYYSSITQDEKDKIYNSSTYLEQKTKLSEIIASASEASASEHITQLCPNVRSIKDYVNDYHNNETHLKQRVKQYNYYISRQHWALKDLAKSFDNIEDGNGLTAYSKVLQSIQASHLLLVNKHICPADLASVTDNSTVNIKYNFAVNLIIEKSKKLLESINLIPDPSQTASWLNVQIWWSKFKLTMQIRDFRQYLRQLLDEYFPVLVEQDWIRTYCGILEAVGVEMIAAAANEISLFETQYSDIEQQYQVLKKAIKSSHDSIQEKLRAHQNCLNASCIQYRDGIDVGEVVEDHTNSTPSNLIRDPSQTAVCLEEQLKGWWLKVKDGVSKVDGGLAPSSNSANIYSLMDDHAMLSFMPERFQKTDPALAQYMQNAVWVPARNC